MRRLELDLFRRGCLAGVAIEGEIAGGDLQLFIRRFARGGVRALNIDLDVTGAMDFAGLGLVAAFVRVDVVIAIAGAPVDGDPDVFEQAAIFVLEARGGGSANREHGAVLVHLGELEFRGLLLNGGRHPGGRGVARARCLNRALRVDAGNDERDRGRGQGRPLRVSRRLLISHLCSPRFG